MASKTLLAGSAVIAAIGIAYAAYFGTEPARHQRPVEPAPANRDTSVVSRLDLGEDGSIIVLSVPDPVLPSSPLLDSRCLLYINKELRTPVMKCLPRSCSQE